METSNNVTTQPRVAVSFEDYLASHPDLYKLSLEEAEETYQEFLFGEDDTGTGMLNPEEDLLPSSTDPNPPTPCVSTVRGDPDLDVRGHCLHLQKCIAGATKFRSDKRFRAVESALEGRLRGMSIECNLEKLLKWLYSASQSIVVGEPLARCPHPRFQTEIESNLSVGTYWKLPRLILGGRVGRQYSHLLKHSYLRYKDGTSLQKKIALETGKTLLMMKKGSPVVSDSIKLEERVKHKTALEDPIAGSHARDRDVIVEEDVRLDDEIVSQIDRTVLEIFKGMEFKPKSGLPSFPSLSSHFHMEGKDGGAAAWIMDSWHHAGYGPRDNNGKPFLKFEVDMESGTREFRHYESQEAIFSQCVIDGLEEERRAGVPAVLVQIKEPMKMRGVTAGPEWLYWLCMEMQKFMWAGLAKHPTFSLVGKPISGDEIACILRRRRGKFLSGDYSAATDNLRSCFSKACILSICKHCKVPEWYTDVLVECLVSHTLYWDREDDPIFRQMNGQLMGSPLSFPILCIINAAVCRMSFDKPLARLALRKLPLKINGDDCGMKYENQEKERWEKNSKHIGMAPSIGKCYYNDIFLEMNSETFFHNKLEDTWERIPFKNFSLTYPRAAKGDSLRDYMSLGSLLKDFVSGSVPDGYRNYSRRKIEKLRSKATKLFLDNQRFVLREAPPNIAWWLPKCYGGLGMPNHPRVVKDRTTMEQRQFASFYHNQMLAGKENVSNPLGRWTLDIHPWLTQALNETCKYEKRTVVFEDSFELLPDANWADVVEEDDSFWGLHHRLSLYTPVLWDFANRVSFDTAIEIAEGQGSGIEKGKKRKTKTKKEILTKEEIKLRERTFVNEVRDAYKKRMSGLRAMFWKSRKRALEEEVVPHPVEEFFRPRHIVTETNDLDLLRLNKLIAAPRDLLSVIPVPNPKEDWSMTNENFSLTNPLLRVLY